MKARLLFASTVTLGILASFVFFVFFLIAFYADVINFWVLIGLTLIVNMVLWLVSPAITDWMQRLFYKVHWVDFEAFQIEHPELAAFLKEVCSRHRIKVPRLRIIDDLNPTAYCYGSYPNNSRVAMSAGIFKYLDIEEQKAVLAHELGHIINLDFIVMTIATTLLQVLYEVYYNLMRRRRSGGTRSKKGDITPLIGLISYLLYIIGSYLVLYLSRTREYMADRFSAQQTGNPNALSMALVKIAYGIAVEANSEQGERLLASTRAMGIYDYKAANSVGTSFRLAADRNRTSGGRDLSKVFLFDIFSPWAFVAEINSTHPLTGKRIRALSDHAKEMGKAASFDFEAVAREGQLLDKKRLYREFSEGIVIYLMPAIAIVAGLILIAVNPATYPMLIWLLGGALLWQGLYKFQRRGGAPEKTTVFELMQDPYANPLRGRYVELEGKVIGKADAGSYFGEDVKMQDRSGCLIYLNYESIFPVLGNIIFGLSRARDMIDRSARAVGWFRRSSYQIVDLDTVTVDGSVIRSYTRLWAIITGACLLAAGTVIFVVSLAGQGI